MMQRRDLLVAGLCGIGALSAYGLVPRRRMSLMAHLSLKDIVPAEVGTWLSRDVSNLVDARTSDSLEDKLYNEVVERMYTEANSGVTLMMLLAHGDSQTNELQLHRPEVCYPAFGFEVVSDKTAALVLAPGAELPVRQLIATAPERVENIVYWTRLGEFLPIDESSQRFDRFQTVLHGFVADGMLARFSVVAEDSRTAMSTLDNFIRQFISVTRPDHRSAFVGTRLAEAMSGQTA